MHHLRQLRSLFWTALLSLAAAAPATGPANASPPKTGEITLTFTQRSPLSSRKEIARRLGAKESELRDDYDLTTFTFRTYVPANYDPSTPYGVFVYLGSHDVPTVPTKWEPFFDKSHMIFIGPDWHSPQRGWELLGLGFDAIHNLQRLYNIDTRRLYDMWFGSFSLDLPIAGADVYSGMIFGRQWEYFRRINLPDHHYVPPSIPPPRTDLLQKARQHGVVLISLTDEPASGGGGPLIATALKQDGFAHVLSITQTVDNVHYPNFAASWITDPVLPFLDKAAQRSLPTPAMTATPDTRPSGTSPATVAGADANPGYWCSLIFRSSKGTVSIQRHLGQTQCNLQMGFSVFDWRSVVRPRALVARRWQALVALAISRREWVY